MYILNKETQFDPFQQKLIGTCINYALHFGTKLLYVTMQA